MIEIDKLLEKKKKLESRLERTGFGKTADNLVRKIEILEWEINEAIKKIEKGVSK